MRNINIASIMNKVRIYSKSEEGKERIKDYIALCITDGRSITAGGTSIVTIDAMKRAADAMIQKLTAVASVKGLPSSVLDHFNSLKYSEPVFTENASKCKIDIYFSDDLSRMSLRIASGKNKGKRTGEGIKNIVSLFDTGYDADHYAYGIWDKHEEYGPVTSLTHRDELRFMLDAVTEFNNEYGELYNVYAYISAEDPTIYSR